MEKLNVVIHLDPDQVAKRQELCHQLHKDPDILEFLRQHQLPLEFIQRYVGKLDTYRQMKQTCRMCKGLDDCPYGIKGEYRDLAISNGKLVQEVKKCQYRMNYQKRFVHLKQYVINHLREELYETSVYRMDAEKETGEYLALCSQLISWLEHPNKGLYFYGGFGVGKTYLASCLCNDFAREGKEVAFINSSEFCNEMRMNWNQSERLFTIIQQMKQVDVLVVDDVGSEIVTNWVRDELLFPILDDRMGNKKLTLFTSNYNYDELLQHFMYNNKGEKDQINAMRLMERIRSSTDLIQINGKNRRF
ncbi:MAG: ATP-binding protein [Erysipelotrichaceae bacterium]|nr:ATP-binding protein [Erysipelotrichaceae bacterium]